MKTTPSPRLRAARRAFTLIELLTVIAIIGILASIVIASVGAVRMNARRADSANNLRQLGMAVLLFADANRGVIPGTRTLTAGQESSWPLDLIPYLSGNEKVFVSTSDQHDPLSDPGVSEKQIAKMPPWQAFKVSSYAWNYQIGGQGRHAVAMRTSDYFAPTKALILTVGPEKPYATRWGFVDNSDDRPSATRYGGKVPAVFLDGHVETLSASAFLDNDPHMNYRHVTDRQPAPPQT